jgi:hypothetical protein
MGKHYKYMKQQEFDLIKTLDNNKIPRAEIVRLTGRGAGTISLVRTCETFDDYRKARSDYAKKYREQREQKAANENPVINVTPTPSLFNEPQPKSTDKLLLEGLKKNNELVVKLTASLDDLVRVLQSLNGREVTKPTEPTKRWPW